MPKKLLQFFIKYNIITTIRKRQKTQKGNKKNMGSKKEKNGNKKVSKNDKKKSGKKMKFSEKHPKISLAIKILILLVVLVVVIGAGVVVGMLYGMWGQDFEISEEELVITGNSVILDRDGNVLAELSGDENRRIIKIDQMSEYLTKAYSNRRRKI